MITEYKPLDVKLQSVLVSKTVFKFGTWSHPVTDRGKEETHLTAEARGLLTGWKTTQKEPEVDLTAKKFTHKHLKG